MLLDILMDDPEWASWSDDALAQATEDGYVVINPIIYAEVSVSFKNLESIDNALPPTRIDREELPYQAGFLAGKAFRVYRQRGGQKRSPLADFYIGAHAAVKSYRLLTRDTNRYRTYFPTVELIAPKSSE
ncbi:type II toxin-antitoxin system VapC family toxin [Streptosporangium sp. NBC_01756]|uniref:type II toxin-antitoxin system VapC family toxin n=1 Tax=Streptosporangium sp. NBC_01756 TaxID=2975950 RepID=UPI002DD841BA|nr:hypothetical protein [Streptosporangium sp. NBC_01756]WSC90144.1 hypothetical protein OIE48_18755 [Streptosporangium sp. NBC_01756]